MEIIGKNKRLRLIIAEHRLHYLFDLTDQIIYLEEGEIKANYSPQALFDLNVITYRQLGLLLEVRPKFYAKAFYREIFFSVSCLDVCVGRKNDFIDASIYYSAHHKHRQTSLMAACFFEASSRQDITW